MASNDISLTPSDVSNQTVPRIAKPPNYIDGGSEEEEDDFDEPRPPPDEHPSTTAGQRKAEPAKQIDANEGVVNGDGIESSARAVDNAVHLDNDTVHDGDGNEKRPPGKKTKEGEEVDKEEKVVRNDGAEGEKKGARKGGDKSCDHQDPLNKEGEVIINFFKNYERIRYEHSAHIKRR